MGSSPGVRAGVTGPQAPPGSGPPKTASKLWEKEDQEEAGKLGDLMGSSTTCHMADDSTCHFLCSKHLF